MSRFRHFYALIITSFFSLYLSFGHIYSLSVLLNVDTSKELEQLQSAAVQAINSIIKEELLAISKKKKAHYQFPTVTSQNHPHITLLFDRTVNPKFEPASVHALETMQSVGRGATLTGVIRCTTNPELFGAYDEFFVLKVYDEHKTLSLLRNDVMNALRYLDRYVQEPEVRYEGLLSPFYHVGSWVKSFFVPCKPVRSIFNETSWYRYEFTPHITLGTLPRHEIFKIASWNRADGKQVWEVIKKRIREVVFPMIMKQTINNDLYFDSFTVYGKNFRVLHTFPCEHLVDAKSSHAS